MNQLSLLSYNEPAPARAPSGRPYQLEAVAACKIDFEIFRRLCMVLFPGGGKTRTASLFLRSVAGRCLWLAATDFLLDQARETIEDITGERTGLEQGKFFMQGERIIVASIQSLHEARLLRKDRDTFDWIVYDEAHGALAPTSRRILDHFQTAKVLGLSATPFRMDKKTVVGEGGLFEKVVFERSILWGIEQGYLVPVQPRIREVKEIDLSEVRTHGGDLKLGDLEKQIIKAAAPIAHIAWEESDHGELPTLIYTPGVASAKAVAATYRALAVEKWGDIACISVDGESSSDQRRFMKREFGKRIRAVANCSLLTQGVDLPVARCAILGRPTYSLALFQQMALRPGRPFGVRELPLQEERIAAIAASPKPWFRLVDLAGNSGRHDLVSIASGIHVGLTLSEQSHLRKRIQANPAATLDEAVVEARKASADEIRRELEKREREIAEAAAQARVTAVARGWDPFRRLGVEDQKFAGIAPDWLDQGPTPDQIVFLKKNKVVVKTQTRGTAAALIRQQREWQAKGLATINQRRVLSRAGIEPNQTYEVASRLYDALKKWQFQPKRAAADVKRVLSEGRQPGED